MTLIQPSPFDDVTQPPRFEGGYNSVLVRYGQFVKELAGRHQLDSADLNTAVVAALEKARTMNPDLAKKLIPDRVHPAASGQLLMAAELLKAWQAPSTVTDVEIDADSKKVVRQTATRVSNLMKSDKLSWSQLDEALPMPIDVNDPVIMLAVNSSDFLEKLDQQRLKVSGLKTGNYDLLIDGDKVASYTQEELSTGVNLATNQTPMLKQAMEVHKLTLEHNNIHFTRWRQVQVPLATFKSSKVQTASKDLQAALDEEEAEVVNRQRTAAQPKEHSFQLVPQ
jgi:hypothetical protein